MAATGISRLELTDRADRPQAPGRWQVQVDEGEGEVGPVAPGESGGGVRGSGARDDPHPVAVDRGQQQLEANG